MNICKKIVSAELMAKETQDWIWIIKWQNPWKSIQSSLLMFSLNSQKEAKHM